MATRTKMKDILNIGDTIICSYTASSGTVGTFSELGTSIKTLIPTQSTATPNGAFYWIYIGKDYLGRKKFIADRNVQHTISWDTLNLAGVVNEISINTLGDNYSYSIRLLTGGISLVDTDNEWDKIILGSTLNGTITAGDNAKWNRTQLYSWTSTSTEATKRRIRGAVEGTLSMITSSSATDIGFRPVLLVGNIDKFLIKQNNFYYSINQSNYDTSNKAYIPLTLSGGIIPNLTDLDTYGFDNIKDLTESNTINGETFKPIGKLDDSFEVVLYKPN